MSAPEICPECGAMVPARARSCPKCGADENTGWSERAQAQRLGIPDDEFDYDEFVQEEFAGEQKPSLERLKPGGIRWLWWFVAVLLLTGIAYSFLRHAFP